MYVKGYFWPTPASLKRLAEIGVEIGHIQTAGHRDLGFDSIDIPDKHAVEFMHIPGNASTPGRLYLASETPA